MGIQKSVKFHTFYYQFGKHLDQVRNLIVCVWGGGVRDETCLLSLTWLLASGRPACCSLRADFLSLFALKLETPIASARPFSLTLTKNGQGSG